MICEVFATDGRRLIGRVEAEPECGTDFCDCCGDCLACFAGDECYLESEHAWVVYLDDRDSVPFLLGADAGKGLA